MLKIFKLFFFLFFFYNFAIGGMGQSRLHDYDRQKAKFIKYALADLSHNNTEESSAKFKTDVFSKHRGILHCSDFFKSNLYKINSINGKVPSYVLFTNVNEVQKDDGQFTQSVDSFMSSGLYENTINKEKFDNIIDLINAQEPEPIESILKKKYPEIESHYRFMLSNNKFFELMRKAGAYSSVDSALEFSQAQKQNSALTTIFTDTYSFIVYEKEFYNLFACEEFDDKMEYFNVVLWGYHLNEEKIPTYTPFFIVSTPSIEGDVNNNIFITTDRDFFLNYKYWLRLKDVLFFSSFMGLSHLVTYGVTNAPYSSTYETEVMMNAVLKYKDNGSNEQKNKLINYVTKNKTSFKIGLKEELSLNNDLGGASVMAVDSSKDKITEIAYKPSFVNEIKCADFKTNVLYSFKRNSKKGSNYIFFTQALENNDLKHISQDAWQTYYGMYKYYTYFEEDLSEGSNSYSVLKLSSQEFLTKNNLKNGVYSTKDGFYYQVIGKKKNQLYLKSTLYKVDLSHEVMKDSIYETYFDGYLTSYRLKTENPKFLNIEKLNQLESFPIQKFNHDGKLMFDLVVKNAMRVSDIYLGSKVGFDLFYHTYSFIRFYGVNYNLASCNELENNQKLVLWGYQIKDGYFEYKPFYIELESQEDGLNKLKLEDEFGVKKEDTTVNPNVIFKSKFVMKR